MRLKISQKTMVMAMEATTSYKIYIEIILQYSTIIDLSWIDLPQGIITAQQCICIWGKILTHGMLPVYFILKLLK